MRNDWSVKNAIIDRVQQEDLAAWAQQPSVPFKPVAGLKFQKPWKPAGVYGFIAGILP